MIRVRAAHPDDLPRYAQIQNEEWGDDMSADEDMLAHRMEVFPEGLLVGENDGRVVAFYSSILLAGYDHREGRSWDDITASGWGSTHVPDGNVLFGVDLSVSKTASRTTSSRMFMGIMGLAMRQNLDAIHWGGRMPRYHKHCDSMSAAEYLNAKNKRGRYLDPEIELYSRVPGVEILGVIPNYFKDWESLDYGVALRWRNPIVRYPFLRPLAGRIPEFMYRQQRRRKAKQQRQ